jgi:hypothetical protein
MKPDRNKMIFASMILGSSLIILGSVLKISHETGGNVLTILGILTLDIYGVMTIRKTK